MSLISPGGAEVAQWVGEALPMPAPLPSPTGRIRPIAPTLLQDGALRGVLQEIRDRSGVSVTELAKRMGVSREAVYQYLGHQLNRTRGKRGGMSLAWLVRYLAAAGGQVVIVLPAGPGGGEAVGRIGARGRPPGTRPSWLPDRPEEPAP